MMTPVGVTLMITTLAVTSLTAKPTQDQMVSKEEIAESHAKSLEAAKYMARSGADVAWTVRNRHLAWAQNAKKLFDYAKHGELDAIRLRLILPRLRPHLEHWKKLSAQYVIGYDGKPIASQLRRAWDGAREMADVTPHTLKHSIQDLP